MNKGTVVCELCILLAMEAKQLGPVLSGANNILLSLLTALDKLASSTPISYGLDSDELAWPGRACRKPDAHLPTLRK